MQNYTTLSAAGNDRTPARIMLVMFWFQNKSQKFQKLHSRWDKTQISLWGFAEEDILPVSVET
jgi:hypothetical protein